MKKTILVRRTVHIPEMDVPRIVPKFKEPTLLEMVQNFEEASLTVAEGLVSRGISRTVVTREQFFERLDDGCRKCPEGLWDENARFGLGKCNHPKCGCTVFKLWFADLTCPIKAWKEQQRG